MISVKHGAFLIVHASTRKKSLHFLIPRRLRHGGEEGVSHSLKGERHQKGFDKKT